MFEYVLVAQYGDDENNVTMSEGRHRAAGQFAVTINRAGKEGKTYRSRDEARMSGLYADVAAQIRPVVEDAMRAKVQAVVETLKAADVAPVGGGMCPNSGVLTRRPRSECRDCGLVGNVQRHRVGPWTLRPHAPLAGA